MLQYGYLRGRSFYDTDLFRTLRNYREKNITYYRTDESGAVEVRTDGRAITVKSILEETNN